MNISNLTQFLKSFSFLSSVVSVFIEDTLLKSDIDPIFVAPVYIPLLVCFLKQFGRFWDLCYFSSAWNITKQMVNISFSLLGQVKWTPYFLCVSIHCHHTDNDQPGYLGDKLVFYAQLRKDRAGNRQNLNCIMPPPVEYKVWNVKMNKKTSNAWLWGRHESEITKPPEIYCVLRNCSVMPCSEELFWGTVLRNYSVMPC